MSRQRTCWSGTPKTRQGSIFMVVVVFFIFLMGMTPTASGFDVQGSGEEWSRDVFQNLFNSYAFVKDNVGFSQTQLQPVLSAFVSMRRGYSSFVATPIMIRSQEAAVNAGLVTSSNATLHAVPFVASGLTMAVDPARFPNSSATSPTNMLAFNQASLMALMTGDLYDWGDSRLTSLNSYITLPPAGTNITLVFCDDTNGQTNVMERYLAAVNPALAPTLAAGGLTQLPPYRDGRVKLACTTQSKKDALSVTGWEHSIVLMMLPEVAKSGGLAPMTFVNAAGTRLVASVGSVTTAMTTSAPNSTSATELEDLVNLGGSAWPLSTLVYAFVQTDLEQADCAKVKELLTFFTWTQINDAAVSVIQSFSAYATLGTVLRRYMLDKLTDIMCNGQQALTTAYLVGEGPPFPTYESWATDYNAAGFKLKYYTTGSVAAISSLIQDAVDFGSTGAALSSTQQAQLPDVRLVPVVVYAYNFVYNIPELYDVDMALLLDFQTVSDIYLNKVKMWNHPNITRLNPEMAHLLPNASIKVVYLTTPQVITQMITQAISLNVPEFNTTVGVGQLVSFPVVEEEPERCIGLASLNEIITISPTTEYSLTAWVSFLALTTPNVKQAALLNREGRRVEALDKNIFAAVQNAPDPLAMVILNAPGPDSWPMITYNAYMVKTTSLTDCNKAKALVDWIYWTQTSDEANQIAVNNKIAVASRTDILLSRMLTVITNVTCDGVHVSSIYGCVSEGQLCSNRGSCVSGGCVCNKSYTGDFCQDVQSSSSSDVLAPILGSLLPAGFLFLLLLFAIVIIVIIVAMRRRRERNDWEIEYDELEVGELLGEGGYGKVHRAMWKGSEVAVKLMAASDGVTRAMITNFTEEARTMSHLRHPNVVLFMAASTKPPNMCIVMEYMQLGSLFDLINNDLIPDIPMALKVKIMYQAAKGMQFLHSSGIVHRDLKSLNLLLDNKWNVKVSDFGLTRFKSSLKTTKNGNAIEGSVPWMAPEVLEEREDIDYTMADVYSYGIIMWEVLTRDQPYHGMLPAQIAVAVIRNDIRPSLSKTYINDNQASYVELMSKCWHRDVTMRPVFLDIMKQLQTMVETLSTGSLGMLTSTSGGSSSSASSAHRQLTLRYNTGGSDAPSSTRSGSMHSGSDSVSSGQLLKQQQARGSVAPRSEVCFVVCDLARCNESWQSNPNGTAKAIAKYGHLVRELSGNGKDHQENVDEEEKEYEAVTSKEAKKMKKKLRKGILPATNEGYLFSRPNLHSGGTFMLAFADPSKAASFALTLQEEVDKKSWPIGVTLHSRVSLHHEPGISGALSGDHSRTGYDSKHFAEACRLNIRCRPGHVICSPTFKDRIHTVASDVAKELYGFKPRGEDAFLLRYREDEDDEQKERSSDDESEHEEEGWDEKWDQGLGLCSSNWCSWIINKDKISIGAKVGEGNFGRVVSGTYYGSTVAIKQLYRSRLDDQAMIKMRKEAALLSNIDHPNVVKLIGLSVGGDDTLNSNGNLMLVMEMVSKGDLRRLLSDNATKLPWKRKLMMLRDAAMGLAFLHSKGIIHRDIKSSNLLVERDLTVKVGDFGFATAKQDNGTQTRCGTPCWTAPEIISGTAKYTEKSDVYSFAIVMWEVLTRKLPFHDKNMMTVALDVINGQRPIVPADCPRAFADMMERCWTGKSEKRATMDEILMYLNSEVASLDA